MYEKASFTNEAFFINQMFWLLVGFVGQKSHNSCALDCRCKGTLVLGAHTAHSAGQNLAFFGDEAAEFRRILVVYVFDVVDTEDANFLFRRSLGRTRGFYFFVHFNTP